MCIGLLRSLSLASQAREPRNRLLEREEQDVIDKACRHRRPRKLPEGSLGQSPAVASRLPFLLAAGIATGPSENSGPY
jgi:hypothetical protein